MGWDRSLQGFFMVINKADRDEPFWLNLNYEPSHPDTLQPFFDVLKKLNIQPPAEMIEEINQDARANQGNKQVIHILKENGYDRIEGIDPYRDGLMTAFSKYAK